MKISSRAYFVAVDGVEGLVQVGGGGRAEQLVKPLILRLQPVGRGLLEPQLLLNLRNLLGQPRNQLVLHVFPGLVEQLIHRLLLRQFLVLEGLDVQLVSGDHFLLAVQLVEKVAVGFFHFLADALKVYRPQQGFLALSGEVLVLEFQVMQLWLFEGEGGLQIAGLPDPFVCESVDLGFDLIRLEEVIIVPPFPDLIGDALEIWSFDSVPLQVELNPLSIDIGLQFEQYLFLLQDLLLPILLLLLFLLVQVLFLLPHLRDQLVLHDDHLLLLAVEWLEGVQLLRGRAEAHQFFVHLVVGQLKSIDFRHESVLLLEVSGQCCAFRTDLPLVADPHLFSSFVLLIDFGLVAGDQVPLSFFIVDLGLVVSLAHGDLVGVVEEVGAGLVQVALLVGRRHHALPRRVWRHSALHGFELGLRERRPNRIKRSP